MQSHQCVLGSSRAAGPCGWPGMGRNAGGRRSERASALGVHEARRRGTHEAAVSLFTLLCSPCFCLRAQACTGGLNRRRLASQASPASPGAERACKRPRSSALHQRRELKAPQRALCRRRETAPLAAQALAARRRSAARRCQDLQPPPVAGSALQTLTHRIDSSDAAPHGRRPGCRAGRGRAGRLCGRRSSARCRHCSARAQPSCV